MSISSKSKINETLDKNLSTLSIRMQEICQSDSLVSKELNYDIDELCREIFYCLDDITNAIKLLNS